MIHVQGRNSLEVEQVDGSLISQMVATVNKTFEDFSNMQ